MKAHSPLLGFNNNVRHKGRVFHIQTEDSGVKHPHVITHLFADGGRIVRSTKTSYAEYVGDEEMPRKVRALMQEQHKAMFIALRAGKFDHLLEGIPLADAQPGHRAPMDSTLSIEVDEGVKVAIPGAAPSNPGSAVPSSAPSSKQAAPPPAKPSAPQAAPPPPESSPRPSSADAAKTETAVDSSPRPSTAEVAPEQELQIPAPARMPSIPPPRNPMPSQGLRNLTPPPPARGSVPPPARESVAPPPVAARGSAPPPPRRTMPPPSAIPATTRDADRKPPPIAREVIAAPRSDPRAEPPGSKSAANVAPAAKPPPPRTPLALRPSTPPPPPSNSGRVDARAEPPPARRSGSLLATLGSGVPSPPKPPSLGATPARRPSPGPSSALAGSLGAGLKPRSDAQRDLGNAPTQSMPATKAAPPPPQRAGAPAGRPALSSSLDLDLEALERAAEQGHSPVYRQVRDLPPPPAAVLRKGGQPDSAYRSLTPPHAGQQQGPASIPAGQGGAAAGRYAPSRPASIFGNARPQEGSSIFGEDLISEKSLDEVILSYLGEDLDAPPKK